MWRLFYRFGMLVLPFLSALLARGPCIWGREEIRGGWQKKWHFSCRLEAICEGNHLSLLDLFPGAAAGDDTEDASTEFTDSIEEEAAHNSHQQVSLSQVLGPRAEDLWLFGAWCFPAALVDREWEAIFLYKPLPSLLPALPELPSLFANLYLHYIFLSNTLFVCTASVSYPAPCPSTCLCPYVPSIAVAPGEFLLTRPQTLSLLGFCNWNTPLKTES